MIDNNKQPALTFGVFDHMDRGMDSLANQYEQRLELVQAYEAAGYGMYHVAEHHFTPLGIAPSPSVWLAAVVQRTKTMHFGPLVYTLSMHHPLRVVEEICMLDQMSRGRLEVGFGRGVSPYEIGYYGVDPKNAQGLYHEGYQVIMQALKERKVNFNGAHFNLRDVPVELSCYQRDVPPIWYGVGLPDGAVWAAENDVNIVCNGPAANVKRITERYQEVWESRQLSTPCPRMGVSRHVVVAPTEREARDTATRAYRLWRQRLMHLWVKHGSEPQSLAFPQTFEDAERMGLGIAGTPVMVREWVQEQVEQMGINYLVCRMAFGDMSFGEAEQSVKLFGEYVIQNYSAHKPALGEMSEAN